MQPICHNFFSTISVTQGKPKAYNAMLFKLQNIVNFLLTELSGAHCKTPEQSQE